MCVKGRGGCLGDCGQKKSREDFLCVQFPFFWKKSSFFGHFFFSANVGWVEVALKNRTGGFVPDSQPSFGISTGMEEGGGVCFFLFLSFDTRPAKVGVKKIPPLKKAHFWGSVPFPTHYPTWLLVRSCKWLFVRKKMGGGVFLGRQKEFCQIKFFKNKNLLFHTCSPVLICRVFSKNFSLVS